MTRTEAMGMLYSHIDTARNWAAFAEMLGCPGAAMDAMSQANAAMEEARALAEHVKTTNPVLAAEMLEAVEDAEAQAGI